MSKVLVLRTCKADLTSSYNGFQWPSEGPVKAPDWNPEPECGFGLHGALWGVGDGFLFNWEPDAKWLVVEVESESIVDLGGKVKFPEGVVVFSGCQEDATQYLQARLPPGSYPDIEVPLSQDIEVLLYPGMGAPLLVVLRELLQVVIMGPLSVVSVVE